MRVYDVDWKAMAEEAERLKTEGTGGGRAEYWRPKTGDNYIRILPPYNSRGLLFKRRKQHYNLPPENTISFCLLSWPNTFDRCPICDCIEKLSRKYSGIIDLGRQQSQDSYAYNIIDRDDERKGVQIYCASIGIHADIQNQLQDKKVGNITDIEDGFDYKITKKIVSGKTSYPSRGCVPRSCPLHTSNDVMEQWLGSLHDLDDKFKAVDEDAAKSIREVAIGMWHYYNDKYSSKHGGDDTDLGGRDKGRDSDNYTNDSREHDRDQNTNHETRDRGNTQEGLKSRDILKGTDLFERDHNSQETNSGGSRDRDEQPHNSGGVADELMNDEPFARNEKKSRDPRSDNRDGRRDTGATHRDESQSSNAKDFLNKHRTKDNSDSKADERNGVMVPRDTKSSTRGLPSCFAGLDKPEQHEDGSIGCSTSLPKCTFCPEEVRCLAEKRKKGLK